MTSVPNVCKHSLVEASQTELATYSWRVDQKLRLTVVCLQGSGPVSGLKGPYPIRDLDNAGATGAACLRAAASDPTQGCQALLRPMECGLTLKNYTGARDGGGDGS